jgi:hypothetical protein
VRLPLSRLTVVVADAGSLAQFEAILRDELNVKTVELVELQADTAVEYGITSRLSVNARAAGPRLGKRVQQVIQAAKAGSWTEVDGVVTVETADGAIALEPAEYDLVLETTGRPEGEALALLPGGGFVLLDTTTTPALEAEGLARDVIRAVQDTRKAAGFDVSDRIRLQLLFASHDDADAVRSAFETADVAGETLALEHAVLVNGHGVHIPGDSPPDVLAPPRLRRRAGPRRVCEGRGLRQSRRLPRRCHEDRRRRGRRTERAERVEVSDRDRIRADAVYTALLQRQGERWVEPRVERTRRVLELLDDPQRTYRVVHVTGTNGKTSTSRIIESLLRAHGLRTGLFTSPHLERFTERIMIDGEPIADAAVADAWDEIVPFVDLVDAELVDGG